MDIVLDCSVALAWALPDETSKRADRFLARAPPKDVFWVPAPWWYELTNALTTAQRSRRLAEADVMRLLELYGPFRFRPTPSWAGTPRGGFTPLSRNLPCRPTMPRTWNWRNAGVLTSRPWTGDLSAQHEEPASGSSGYSRPAPWPSGSPKADITGRRRPHGSGIA